MTILQNLLKVKSPKQALDRITTSIYLHCIGYNTPDCGPIETLARDHKMTEKCVMWTAGGSKLMTIKEAIEQFPRRYAALHVGHQNIAISCKYVQIGNKGFYIDLVSTDDWRSNHGNCSSELVSTIEGYHPLISLPCFSIDFVRHSDNKNYAIDMDVEPRKLGKYFTMSPKEFKTLYVNAQKYFLG